MQINQGSFGQRLLSVAAVVVSMACMDLAQGQTPAPAECVAGGNGYLKAKVAGAIDAEFDWRNRGTTCTGEARPSGGVRVSFKNRLRDGSTWLIVFGIPDLQEGQSAKALAANLTLVREGSGQFYSTQGADKCTIDSVRQEAVKGAPHKSRTYRIIARGFCTEPARALQGEGSILMSRFDFASLLNFAEDEVPTTDDATSIATAALIPS